MKRWFLVPPSLAIIGIAWMYLAAAHYERATGRRFYGLAGYYSSWPNEVFHPAPGGEAIERWSVSVPSLVTAGLLGTSAILSTVIHRRAGLARLSLWWLTTIASGLGFLFAASWVTVNIRGVFV